MSGQAEGERGIKALRLVLAGRVQGVGFRYFTRRLARELGLRGWVRNLPDGRVEIEVGGDALAVTKLVAGVRAGPPGALVTEVEEQELFPVRAWDGFDIVR